MSCCGNARNARLRAAELQPGLEPGTIHVNPTLARTAYFAYKGATRLTVIGGVTRTLYRFEGPGARSIVDGRDVPSLSAVPMLVRL